MLLIQISWKIDGPKLIRDLGFHHCNDGLIRTRDTHTPIKCIYCGTVLHLRNINILEINKAVCKDVVCTTEYVFDEFEE